MPGEGGFRYEDSQTQSEKPNTVPGERVLGVRARSIESTSPTIDDVSVLDAVERVDLSPSIRKRLDELTMDFAYAPEAISRERERAVRRVESLKRRVQDTIDALRSTHSIEDQIVEARKEAEAATQDARNYVSRERGFLQTSPEFASPFLQAYRVTREQVLRLTPDSFNEHMRKQMNHLSALQLQLRRELSSASVSSKQDLLKFEDEIQRLEIEKNIRRQAEKEYRQVYDQVRDQYQNIQSYRHAYILRDDEAHERLRQLTMYHPNTPEPSKRTKENQRLLYNLRKLLAEAEADVEGIDEYARQYEMKARGIN